MFVFFFINILNLKVSIIRRNAIKYILFIYWAVTGCKK